MVTFHHQSRKHHEFRLYVLQPAVTRRAGSTPGLLAYHTLKAMLPATPFTDNLKRIVSRAIVNHNDSFWLHILGINRVQGPLYGMGAVIDRNDYCYM